MPLPLVGLEAAPWPELIWHHLPGMGTLLQGDVAKCRYSKIPNFLISALNPPGKKIWAICQPQSFTDFNSSVKRLD